MGSLSMIGQTLGHYRISEKLGAGGMGVVYRARDEQLGRDVALKVLPADTVTDEASRARLLGEARTASALNHPHICTIHEVGEADEHTYVVMELVEGQPLSAHVPADGLPVEAVVRYGAQVAEALAHAHERGIVHRDLKTSNVMITSDGRAKVLDFGLAQRLWGEELADATRSRVSLAEAGGIAGTLHYLAPEVLRGQPADARSDLWALGVVLYEMAAGVLPFQAQTGFELSAAILRELPAPLPARVPAGLRAVIQRCLAKEPGQRYQRASEVRAALDALQSAAMAAPTPVTITAARLLSRLWPIALALAVLVAVLLYFHTRGATPIDSLAVLPFANATGDANTEYLSDGLTESIINTVSQVPNLKVIARTSIFRYKKRDIDPKAVGRDLGVRAMLTGSVAQRGENLSISVELVDTRDNRHIWGEQYNRNLRDVLAMQDEIAQEISDNLRLRLTGEEKKRLTKRYTENGEAYQAYLKGRYYSSKYTEEGLKKGFDYFRQAIAIDPTYALAYAGLTVAYWNVSSVQFAPQEVMPKAKEAALKALEIDDTLAESHAAVALVKMAYDWERAGAEREYRRAIELNPGYALAYEWHGWHLALMGRLEESVAELQRAQERDPLSAEISAFVGLSRYWARQYGPATEQLRKAVELDQNFWFAHELLGWAYQQSGAFPKALAEFQTARRLDDNPWTLADLGHLYAVQGKRADALKVLAELKERARRRYVSPYFIAKVYTGLKEKEQAFAWLEKAYEARDESLTWLKVDPAMENLGSDPRFHDLLRRLGLPETATRK